MTFGFSRGGSIFVAPEAVLLTQLDRPAQYPAAKADKSIDCSTGTAEAGALP